MATLSSEALERHNTPGGQASGSKKLGSMLSQPSMGQHGQHHKPSQKSETGSTVGGLGGKGLAGLMMMKRKMRNWKRGGPGSTMGSSIRSGPKMALENSYRLEPTDGEVFNEEVVKQAMEESIKLFMGKQTGYNPAKSAQISRYLSEDIKSRVKKLNFKRYKFVVHVMMGQSHEQGMQYCTRCIWDTNNDNVATVVYRHKDLFIVANVFATYFE